MPWRTKIDARTIIEARTNLDDVQTCTLSKIKKKVHLKWILNRYELRRQGKMYYLQSFDSFFRIRNYKFTRQPENN